MPKIIDNLDILLSKELNETISESKRVDFCVGYFNLRGWKEIADKIEDLEGEIIAEGEDDVHRICRLLIGMSKMPNELISEYYFHKENEIIDNKKSNELKKKIALEFRNQLTLGIPNDKDEFYLRKLSNQLKSKKVCVKLFLKHSLHAKLYLAYTKQRLTPIVGYLGSSNLTLAGLSKQGELNIDVIEQDAAKKLERWFDERWNDRWCVDITDELIAIIDDSWAGDKLIPPYHIYLKIIYHLSKEAISGISQFSISNVFKRELLPFQQNAVKIAAHHLKQRGGVIIGDVVGLGKTITATAIAKTFQDDFLYKCLIICPPNLVEMWKDYRHKFDLNCEILSSGQVIKTLPDERRYKLIIIDESHNLRNSNGKRYRAIKEYISENESKVILLSATPYNKSFTDLSNQLGLFLNEDYDLSISPEKYISSLQGVTQFSHRFPEVFIRGIKAFEKSPFVEDWRELMRLFMVRRTRSFIKNNYAQTDESNGRKYLTFYDGTRSYFPDRIPKKVEYKFNPNDTSDQYSKLYSEKVVEIINSLILPRYGLGIYLDPKPKDAPSPNEKLIIDNLSRAGKRLMGFCRTNLFKRLESSGYSFLLSLGRHIVRNYIFIYAIQNHLDLPIGKQVSEMLDDFIDDQDLDDPDTNIFSFSSDEKVYTEEAKALYNLYQSHNYFKKFDWISYQFFKPELLQYLIEDSQKLLSILKVAGNWHPSEDKQLNALYDLITKVHPDEKLLVFTQFADTANYLAKELKNRGVKEIEPVTGSSENPTALAHRFSPFSNKKEDLFSTNRQLRVLISTDVLSEGQNLQDSHIVINYDLPWAIIRLIQRAGRVDRIGQKAEKILCYSFLPEEGVDNIIRLRNRLAVRIKENAEVVGADEVFFDGDPINLHDLYSEKANILDEDETDTDVDLSSYAYQIWKNAIDKDSSLKKIIPELPDVIYSTKKNTFDENKEGIVVYTKTAEDNDLLSWLDLKGSIITQSQLEILKAIECTPDTLAEHRLEQHHTLVKRGVEQLLNEERSISGTLGRKTGVKYRAFTRMENYYNENSDTLFANIPLKKAVDEIYKYPMTEYARDTVNRELKSGISDEDLSQLIISLHDENKLCINDDSTLNNREPRIICSMGLKNT